MFAAGDANDGELTSEIYEHHGGNDAPNLKQCRRRYRAATAATEEPLSLSLPQRGDQVRCRPARVIRYQSSAYSMP